jgi:hypothetical protein
MPVTAKFALNPEQVQSHVVRQLENWVSSMPEAERSEPFVEAAGGHVALSPLEILQNVQDGTDLGVELMEHAVALAVSDTLIDH